VRRLSEAFAPLAKHDAGLPGRAALFVATGDDSAVLLDLAQHRSNPLELGHAHAYARGEAPHLGALYALLRDELFAEPQRLLRLGRVLAATESNPIRDYWYAGTDRCPAWFRILATTASMSSKKEFPNGEGMDLGVLTVERSLATLALDDAGPLALLDFVFAGGGYSPRRSLMQQMPDLSAYLARHPEDVAEAARAFDAESRAKLAEGLRSLGAVNENLATLVELAVGPAKSVREAAVRALSGTDRVALQSAVAPVFQAKSVEPKVHAVSLLTQILGSEARHELEAQLAAKPPKKLADAIALNLAALTASAEPADGDEAPDTARYRAVDGTFVDIPPAPEPPPETPFPSDLRRGLNAAVDAHNAQQKELYEVRKAFRGTPRYYDHSVAERFFDVADGKPSEGQSLAPLGAAYLTGPPGQLLQPILADPRVTLRHLLRLYHAAGFAWHTRLLPPLAGSYMMTVIHLQFKKRMLAEAGDARAVLAMHAAVGLSAEAAARTVFTGQSWEGVEPSLAPFVWPFLAESIPLFEEAFGVRPVPPDAKPASIERALAALRFLPKTPQRLLAPLMRVAVTGTKAERRAARELIATAPGLDESIAGLLADGKSETRGDAALWLAERQARPCVPQIRAALKAEKNDKARASFLSALSALGDDIAPFVGEETLLEEAQRGLQKTGTKGLDWFPFHVLPAVRWASGESVSPEIVRWWVVLANKLKEPAGNPLFEFYFDRMRAEDVAALAGAILSIFIERDTQRPSEADAIAYADERADKQFAAYVRYQKDIKRETIYARLKAEFLSQYLSSASDNRGILALATRANGPEAAGKVRAYLKNHGARTSQAKALVSCLSANPHPSAIQVVLATANRFKQRTVQEHAAALVQSIAEARGWTPDELADNTIPSAGLDENGALELDCGPERVFSAVLDASGKLDLRGPQGKPAKSLPAARGEADNEPLKEAKRLLASAKKEVAQVFDLQAGRLYEAMCLERTWSANDWERLLAGHPIVRHLCRRLVWLALDASGAVVASFRPLDDGTLSGPADESVELAPSLAVKVAHRAIVDESVAEAWKTHLADYEVTPLFEQFSRPVLAPNEEEAKRERIVDRRGWMIETLKLRGAATKRGYQPGRSEDGGVFVDYIRRHPGAGLQTEIGFTGSFPGQENAPAALTELGFARTGRFGNEALPLRSVPPVLLSEAWNDYHEIAAAGSGFDPDWQKKSQY